MQYEHVVLCDRGDLLAVYFEQDSILDQQVADEVKGKWFTYFSCEVSAAHI